MGENPKHRAKHPTAPPRVCADCFWRRRYYELCANFDDLRLQMIKIRQEQRDRNIKRGSGTMPTSQTFNEIGDDPETEKLVDRLRRSGE